MCQKITRRWIWDSNVFVAAVDMWNQHLCLYADHLGTAHATVDADDMNSDMNQMLGPSGVHCFGPPCDSISS